MTSRLQLRREMFDLSVSDLSELSDVSTDAIRRIESEHNPYRTNVSVAEALADALDTRIGLLFDDDELSHLGRPAHTGKPIIRIVRRTPAEMVCPDCFTLVPADIGCEVCGQPEHSVV